MSSLEPRVSPTSDLRASDPRRRVRAAPFGLEGAERLERATPNHTTRTLQQTFPWAALGSFRWPPYLLAVWVLVLVLTHALHCLVTLLDHALPALRKCTNYFRAWTEEEWHANLEINQRLYPISLAVATGFIYTLYFGLYAVYAVALWSVEPLYPDEDNRSCVDVETKVTDYVDDNNSKTNASIKQSN